MSQRRVFKFVNASPAHTQVEKDHIRAEASGHAARVSHQRRRIAEKAKARLPVDHQPLQPIRKFSDLNISADEHQDSTVAPNEMNLSICLADHGFTASPVVEFDGPSQDDQCNYNDSFECLSVTNKFPAIWYDWTSEDVADLQFFMTVFGASVQNLSDGGFFNIVVPCLAGANTGARNLMIAAACTYRKLISPCEARHRAMDIRAYEKCNKGIRSFSDDLALASSEVSLTCCILLTIWYMLRLEPKAADVCTRAAEDISQMDKRKRLKCRIVSARNATDPQSSSNYRMSTFSQMTVGTVAKLALQSSCELHDLTVVPDLSLIRLDLSSDGFSFQIKDMHDLLSSVEAFFTISEQLRSSISYHAFINHNSALAQDLLRRLNEIAGVLEQTHTQDGTISTAMGILWQWYRVHNIGLRCQVLSNSEMLWDLYTGDFLLLVEWIDGYLAQTQDESLYIFLHSGIVVRPLWFTAIHCRDPYIRGRAITVLLKYHRNEAGFDSWSAGHIAREVMLLEQGDRNVRCASDICEIDRIVLRGFEVESDGLCLLHMYATELDTFNTNTLRRRSFNIPRDPHGVVQMWQGDGRKTDVLDWLAMSVGQTLPQAAPTGSFASIYYDDEIVEMSLPEKSLYYV